MKTDPIPAWAVKVLYPDRAPNENEWYERPWQEVALLVAAVREKAIREAAGAFRNEPLARIEQRGRNVLSVLDDYRDAILSLIDKEPAS